MKGFALACLLAGAVNIAGCSAQPGAVPSPTVPSPASPMDCTDEVATSAFATVSNQQAAFASTDFAEARRMASEGFRSQVTLQEFKAIIEDGYAFLLGGPPVALAECRMDGTGVVLRIEVDAKPSVAMAYRLVLEGDEWRIDGASILRQVSA